MSVRSPGRHLDDIGFEVLRIAALAALLAVIVVPFVYVVSVSFRSPAEFFTAGIYLVPKEPTLEPWVSSFGSLAVPLKNSLLIASGTMIISLIITIPGAYVFGRKEFPGKRIGFYGIVVALMFPYIILVIPLADIWYDFQIHDTIPGMWIAYQTFVAPFAIWILRDFFEKLPTDLEEAARVYGCTQWGAFVRVILPLSAPAIAAVGFLAFLTGWNDYLFSSLLTTGSGVRPSIVVLFNTTTGGERNYWALIMAQTLIVGTPPAVLYMVARRHITNAFAV
ncbi:MAG: carbohydrate ABC transporter permease [Haloarculaceae archaeon]|jgi:ABC-type glycerol-3-phosphate transport system permease component